MTSLHASPRSLAVALSFSLLFPALGAAAPTLVVNYTFNSDAAGLPAPSFYQYGSQDTVAVYSVSDDNTDRALYVSDTTSGGYKGVGTVFAGSPGIITYQYSIRLSQRTQRIEAAIYDSEGAEAAIVFFTVNGVMRVYNGGVSEQVRTYSANTWYAVKLVLDTYRQKFSLWVDGTLYKQDLAFYKTTQLRLSRVQFFTDTPNTGSFYIDNVRVETAPDEFDTTLARWADLQTGVPLDLNDAEIAASVKAEADAARTAWTTLKKGADRDACDCLWTDIAPHNAPSKLASTYGRLRDMAVAYATPGAGSGVYRSGALAQDIRDAMRWLNLRYYNYDVFVAKGTDTSSWAQYEFSIPLSINDILALMYGDFTPIEVLQNTSTIEIFTPDCAHAKNDTRGIGKELSHAANRVWLCEVAIVKALLEKDVPSLVDAREKLSEVFMFASNGGEGFYPDGSFIQHEGQPYNGSYGLHALRHAVHVLTLLRGTSWAITEPTFANMYTWVYEAFEPFLYQGGIIDSVRGRAVARTGGNGQGSGTDIAASIAKLAEIVPAPRAETFKAIVKELLRNQTYYPWRTNSHPWELRLTKKIVDDPSIVPLATWSHNSITPITFIFGNMDRVLHRAHGFMFGIAMSSKRIKPYEVNDRENSQGWDTGYGMTYLMNGDKDQYEGNTWATQDPHRRPGTTVERVTSSSKYSSPSTFAGGASFRYNGVRGSYGVAGMELDQDNSTLVAKKSWFMFDDEIVALGSGISCATPCAPETIVENRKLNMDGTNAFRINNVLQSSGGGRISGTNSFAHLAGSSGEAGDIGYFFPGTQTWSWARATTQGDWSQIGYGDAGTVQDPYLQMVFAHGVAPSNGDYAYALLPGMTAGGVVGYADAPDFRILEKSTEAHAVFETTLGCFGANFWKDGLKKVGTVRSNRRASVITCERGSGLIDVAISDPTQENPGTIEIEIDGRFLSTGRVDPGVSVVTGSATTKFIVNVANAHGRPFYAQVTR